MAPKYHPCLISKKICFLFAIICISALSSFAQFSFIHITDLHVANAPSLVNSYDINAEKFQCYIKEFPTLVPKPAFVVAGGDITNVGNEPPDGMYPTLTRYLFPPTLENPGPGAYCIDSANTIPIYFTPGNHDYYTSLAFVPTSSATLSYYPKYIAPDSDYVITTGIAVIICMRSGYDGFYFNDGDPTNPEGTGFSNAQCTWLRNVLEANADKRKIIVFHHPAVDVAGTNSDGTPFTGAVLNTADGSLQTNRTNFLNICDSNRVDVVLNGHVHQNVVADRTGNVINENCATCGTRYVQTGAALNRSYRIITVDSSFVTVSTPLLSCNNNAVVNEFGNSIHISVFPNPVTNKISIETAQKSSIEILNIQGRILKSANTSGNHATIDISGFAKGMYFVKVKTEKTIAVKKFVKE